MVITAPSAENVSSSILPGGFAVDRVGKVGAELVQIGLVDAAADLFVGREQDLDRAVLDVRMADQEMRGIDDFGKAGLVVGAEQGGAVGGDDVVADLIGERGMLGGADDLAGIARQHDVAAAIVADDLRLDVLAGAVGRGVHMRAETDDRHLLGGIGGNGRIDVAVLIEMGVAKADRLQFRREQAAQILLLVGGWAGWRGRVGLGVDDHVAQEALGHGVFECKSWGHNQNRGRMGGRTAGTITKSAIPGPRMRAGMTPKQFRRCGPRRLP